MGSSSAESGESVRKDTDIVAGEDVLLVAAWEDM